MTLTDRIGDTDARRMGSIVGDARDAVRRNEGKSYMSRPEGNSDGAFRSAASSTRSDTRWPVRLISSFGSFSTWIVNVRNERVTVELLETRVLSHCSQREDSCIGRGQ